MNLKNPEQSFELDEFLSEFCGSIIGDGCMYNKHGHNTIMISGNISDDKEYYKYLSKNLEKITGRKPIIKIHERTLRLIIHNKKFFNFLTSKIGMFSGTGKTYNVTIPEKIEKSGHVLSCVRGIADTDGSIFTSNKPGTSDYPSIEITTASENLANQIFGILDKLNFRVRIRNHKPENTARIYKISLNGWEMMMKWYNEIGFSHPRKNKDVKNIIEKRSMGMVGFEPTTYRSSASPQNGHSRSIRALSP